MTTPSIRKNLKNATKFNPNSLQTSQNTLIEEEEDTGISKSTTSTSLLSLALGQGENKDINNIITHYLLI